MASNSKQIWMTILIAAIVGILSSAITASIVSKNVLFGPQESLKIIKANSCDADGVCEIISAEITNSVYVGGEVVAQDDLIAFDELFVGKNAEINGTLNVLGGSINTNYDVTANDDLIAQDDIAAFGLRGNGTSYVCVNSEGIFIRSNTACR